VPYRGSAPAMQDLVAGHIDMMIDAPVTILPQLRDGWITAYALLAKSRLGQAPQVPTGDEAGLPDFYVSNWLGFWVPKGTPKDIVDKLNAAVTILAEPNCFTLNSGPCHVCIALHFSLGASSSTIS
jgi:tripartite-type tricarboxylate transporter receptor subunit TctC